MPSFGLVQHNYFASQDEVQVTNFLTNHRSSRVHLSPSLPTPPKMIQPGTVHLLKAYEPPDNCLFRKTNYL